MNDAISMSGEQLLAIKEPEAIFPFSEEDAKNLYRKLARRWHPDGGGNDDVFAHIKALHEDAKKLIALGFWRGPKSLHFRTKKGIEFALAHKRHREFELGDVFIGDRFVTYAVKSEYADLADRFVRTVKSFTFQNNEMRTEMGKYLPKIHDVQETLEYVVIVVAKGPDVYALRDVMSAMGGKIPAVHVAWIVSSILNLLCYLELQQSIVHCDISPDTFFVSPSDHRGELLGGWFYATPCRRVPVAAPGRTIEICPQIGSGASYAMDALCARSMALEALGDAHGSRLLLDKSIPSPMLTHLRSLTTRGALDEYRTWKESVLPKCFGKPKFVKLELGADDVYR